MTTLIQTSQITHSSQPTLQQTEYEQQTESESGVAESEYFRKTNLNSAFFLVASSILVVQCQTYAFRQERISLLRLQLVEGWDECCIPRTSAQIDLCLSFIMRVGAV